MESNNSNASLKRSWNNSEEIGFFKIIQTDTYPADETINSNKKVTISEYKIVNNETRQSNRHKTPSGVWKYFALATKFTTTSADPNDVQDDRILCLLCYAKGRVHVYKSKTSSSNLWKHLNRKHNIEIPSEKIFAVCPTSFDGFEYNPETEEGNNSTDDQMSVPEVDSDVLIKPEDFEQIDEYKEDDEEMQVISNEEEIPNVKNILKYAVCPSNAVHKDIGLGIIEEVAKRPILYEAHAQSSKLPSVRATKEMIWMEVYEALGEVIPIERIQNIWKNIRDRYKKIRNNEKHGLECLQKYKYYDHLKFLDDCDISREQSCEDGFDESPEKKCRNDDFAFLIEQTDGILTTVEDLVQNDQNYGEDVVSETSNCTVSSSHPLTATIFPMEVQPKFSEDISKERCPTPASTSMAVPVSNNNEQMDEFDLFGRFIANKLRSAPKDRVNLIEVKIMQAIVENI